MTDQNPTPLVSVITDNDRCTRIDESSLVVDKRHRRLASRSLEKSSRCQVRGFGDTSSRFLKTLLHVPPTKWRGNSRGANGAGHRALTNFGQLETGGAQRFGRKVATFTGWHEPV